MTCWHLRDARCAAALYPLLRPYSGRVAVASPLVAMLGPIDECLGALATVLGRFDEADTHFAAALALSERMRALPWQAQIRAEWAGALLARGGSGDGARGRALLAEAESLARPIGMELRLGWIDVDRARPSDSPRARAAALRCDGDLWTLEFEGRTTRVRDMVGLRYLARLVENPGCELASLQLAAPEGAATSHSGELLDAQARREYASRLRALEGDLAEAERNADLGRSERLGDEIERLRAELTRGFGLGGRSRVAGSPSERARLAVTRAIRYAIERIGERDEELAEHLSRSVRTGVFCAYEPSSRDRVTWTL